MKEKLLTCIICPRGCSLKVTLDEANVPTRVEGNACPRGEDYAIAECTRPMRTVTSTVKCADGSVVAVKTNKSVPKEKVFDVMGEINKALLPAEHAIGDVVISDVCQTGADVVVTGK